ARLRRGNAHPSQTDLGPLACLGSTCGIALTLARLGDQFPQAGLQRRPTAGVAQPSTRKLFGLDSITLGQADLGQAIQHLGLTRRDALRTPPAGRRAVELT